MNTVKELDKWAKSQIARHQVGKWLVSTVDLAALDVLLDSLKKREHKRYETMVFAGDSSSEEECVRYDTLDEAVAGHQELVNKYKEIE